GAGRSFPVDRSGRHGHAASRDRRTRRRSVDAEASGRFRRGDPRRHRRRSAGPRRGRAMIAATEPHQRPADAKLLIVDAFGRLRHASRADVVDYLRAGDLVIANDAATLPASLTGTHARTGAAIEVRLAGRRSLAPDDVHAFSAIAFGEGDFRTPTENRPPPPSMAPGDRLALGPLRATVTHLLGHPRLVAIAFDGSADDVWAGLARHGRP